MLEESLLKTILLGEMDSVGGLVRLLHRMHKVGR